MTTKTIIASVLAVSICSAGLGFVSQYRSNSGNEETTQVLAATSNKITVSHKANCQDGECQGCCASGDPSGGKECCQMAALSKNVASLSSEGHGGESHGACASGDASGGKECCQTAALSKNLVSLSSEKKSGECHGACASGDASGGKECCQGVDKANAILASPK